MGVSGGYMGLVGVTGDYEGSGVRRSCSIAEVYVKVTLARYKPH